MTNDQILKAALGLEENFPLTFKKVEECYKNGGSNNEAVGIIIYDCKIGLLEAVTFAKAVAFILKGHDNYE